MNYLRQSNVGEVATLFATDLVSCGMVRTSDYAECIDRLKKLFEDNFETDEYPNE